MGTRTAVHQAALGCRYKCEFCGVVSMWNGKTMLDTPERLRLSLRPLRDRWGANGIQFYDHNFFDREETSDPGARGAREARHALVVLRARRHAGQFLDGDLGEDPQSRLRMAYIGAEAASDEALRRMRKGSQVEHTFEVARRCREYGVIPEFSFVLGGPEDPEGEVEKTLSFVRRVKEVNPESEIILYFYSPTPQRERRAGARPPTPPVRRACRCCTPTARRGRRCRRRPRSGPSRSG